MTDLTTYNGWKRLHNGYDVELIHGIPTSLSNNGLPDPIEDAELTDAVSQLFGLKTTILGWHESANKNECETALCIDAIQFREVLTRLAKASAALFVERYHTPITHDSVDWDKEEFDSDFNRALEHCCLDMNDIDKAQYYEMYRRIMHAESERLIIEGAHPIVEPE